MLVMFAAATVCTAAVPGGTRGDVRRETPPNRPYIVEVGEPSEITMPAVEREATRNISDLRESLNVYGLPDYAETQEIEPEWPWQAYEVRLYYLRRNLEADFGHVYLSPAMANFGVLKSRGEIPPAKKHLIEVILEARQTPPPAPPPMVGDAAESAAPSAPAAPPPAPAEQSSGGGLTEALVARIEAAAERAALAADHAAESSEAAMRAADRTVSLVEKMERSGGPR